jgi:hypothetical protein
MNAVQPGQGPFYHPAVPPQPPARLDAPACDAGPDGAGPALLAAAPVIIHLVGVELFRAFEGPSPSAPDARHGVQGRRQHDAVVPVGGAQAHPERCASAVDHTVALRAWFAAISRGWAGLGAPFLAATEALSSAARLQSRCPAFASRCKSTRWRPAQAPVSCQSRSLRQQVMPEQPNSLGNISYGMPERRTKLMLAKTARSSHRGRPPLGLRGSAGSSGLSTPKGHPIQGAFS